MYYNKKRIKLVALLGVALLVCVCGCAAEAPVQEKQESVAGKVTEAVARGEAEITQAATEGAEGTTKEAEPTAAVEEKPEEQVLRLLTEAEDLYFTSGGVMATELLGYVKETEASYFIMKKQNDLGLGGEMLYIGAINPETYELIQCDSYGNTTADAAMIQMEQGTYIMYCTECTDFGLISGNGGVLLARDGKLTPVWPLAEDGMLDDAFWNRRTVTLNGTAFELYKVITEEGIPGVPALQSETEFERTITLEEILGEVKK